MRSNDVKPYRVVVVEDEQLFREMLILTLSADRDIDVVAAYSRASDILDQLDRLSFDVALLDIRIEGNVNGYELGIELHRLRPDCGIVLLSNYLEPAFINALRRRQLIGWSYLLKDSITDVETVKRAIKGAVQGEIVIDPAIRSLLTARKETALARLTPREYEILGLIAEGYSNRAIAERIIITVKSVENSINRIYSKLGIESGDAAIQPRVAAVLSYLREARIADPL